MLLVLFPLFFLLPPRRLGTEARHATRAVGYCVRAFFCLVSRNLEGKGREALGAKEKEEEEANLKFWCLLGDFRVFEIGKSGAGGRERGVVRREVWRRQSLGGWLAEGAKHDFLFCSISSRELEKSQERKVLLSDP